MVQRNLIRFSQWPFFSDDEITAVTRVLKSGRVNQWTGEEVLKLEDEFGGHVGVKYAVALSNGTVALELALKALGIGPGDEVVVTPRSFIASASCVVSVGAKPVFADVDCDSGNITADSISNVLTNRTKAVVAVHLAGWPCDMDPILDLARERGLYVIEDCAQAHGATYKGRSVGSLGDIAAFSFCQDKIITTGGEGGMVTTNDKEIWEKVWSYKDHGKSYNAVFNREPNDGFRWVHESFGTNYRMTEMQAAIGRIQLKKLPEWLRLRRRNAEVLTNCFSKIPALRVTTPPKDVEHAYYKYYAFVKPEALKSGWDRDRIIKSIEAEGVPCQSGICSEIYLEKAFEVNGLRPPHQLSVARELGETSLMFLVHPTLSEENMYNTCRAVDRVFKAATR